MSGAAGKDTERVGFEPPGHSHHNMKKWQQVVASCYPPVLHTGDLIHMSRKCPASDPLVQKEC